MSKIVDLTGLSRFWSNVDKKKASIDGTYPDLTAGDLAGRGESVPASFGFRASGGKSIKDGRAYIKAIKGNSVVWNQLCKPFANADVKPKIDYTFLDNGGVSVSSWAAYEPFRFNVGLTRNAGHKFLLMAEYTNTSSTKSLIFQVGTQYVTKTDEKGTIATIGTIAPIEGNTFADYIAINTQSVQDGVVTIQGLRFIDLTQMFQAGNEPTTIEEFNARVATLGIDMNAYNEGEVIHCNTESIKSVGDNAWGGELEKGLISNGVNEANNNMVRSVDYIRILPSEQYYALLGDAKIYFYPSFYDADKNYIGTSSFVTTFTTPSNAEYMRFFLYDTSGGIISTDYNDIMISLVHSGWKAQKDDQYQPYWQDILPLPIISKYFPNGMKKAGSAFDEIRFNKATKKWEYSKGRIKSVDLGDLDWSYYPAADGYPFGFFYASPQGRKYGEKNILCGKYAFGYFANDKSILGNTDGENIYIMDSAYTDAASFKAMLQEKQVKLYYESNNWEWEELDVEDQNFRDYYNVADFGTEMSQSNNVPSAAFSADIIYQFNAVDMIREHEMEINELQDAIKAMQAQLTSLINK